MDDLADAVDSLRYLVARPGTFEQFYPETTEDMVITVLVDAMAECHLEGLLLDYDADEDGALAPPITKGQAALVVLFGAVRFLRAELLNRNTSVTYKAGSASYETTQATNILRDILKGLLTQRDRAVEISGSSGGAAAAFYMADQYLARVWETPVTTSGW